MTDRIISVIAGGGYQGREARLFESTDSNPEVYVDGIQGLVVVGGVVKLNFFRRALDQSLEPGSEFERRDVACRAVMSIETFLSVVDLLKATGQDIQAEIAKQGGPLQSVKAKE